MNQPRLFFEDINDALKECALAISLHVNPKEKPSFKVVGARLWPEILPDTAGRKLADCLNPLRDEKLSPAQVLLILRWACEVGCHAGMQFIAMDAGYEIPTPLCPDEERDQLVEEIAELNRHVTRLAKAAERLQKHKGR